MTYQYPQALYLFLLIPLLIALYFIRTKRTEHYTPAYFLWVRLAEQVRPKSRWQQVFRNLSLLLQLLTVIALILALAKPRFAEGDSAQPVVLVVDNSASMGTREGKSTRLKQAKELALGLLEALGKRKIVLAGTVGGHERLFGLNDDRAELAAYIERLPATDGADDLPRLIPRLLARWHKPPLIYVIGDGAGPGMARLLTAYPGLNFIKVGRMSDNLAVIGLEARRNPLSPGKYQVMIRVGNYSSDRRRVRIETTLGNRLLDAGEVEIAAGGQASIIIEGQGDEGGIIHSRMLLRDALAVDNQAYTILRPRRDISLLLVNVSNKHLQRALGIMDRLRIIPLSKRDYRQLVVSRPYTRYDMGVFYGFMPRKLLSWYSLIIDPGDGSPINISSPLTWDQSHPLMSYLDFSPLRIRRARMLRLFPQSQVLLQAGGVPLLVYDARQRFGWLRLGFALEDSDFALRPSFPIFLLNVINFFSAQAIPRNLVQLKAGEPYLIPLAAGQLTKDETGYIINPRGDKIPISLHPGEDNYYYPLRAGKYQFVLDGFRADFVVNPAEGESRISPYAGSSSPVAKGGVWGVLAAYLYNWRSLVLLALGLVVLEWWYQWEKGDALY
jgi:hypothetical protein